VLTGDESGVEVRTAALVVDERPGRQGDAVPAGDAAQGPVGLLAVAAPEDGVHHADVLDDGRRDQDAERDPGGNVHGGVLVVLGQYLAEPVHPVLVGQVPVRIGVRQGVQRHVVGPGGHGADAVVADGPELLGHHVAGVDDVAVADQGVVVPLLDRGQQPERDVAGDAEVARRAVVADPELLAHRRQPGTEARGGTGIVEHEDVDLSVCRVDVER